MSTILDSRYSWTRAALSLGIATVGNVGLWSIIVILPAVQAEFGGGRGGASLPYTMTMLGFALGNLVIGRAVDRYGIARALAIAGAVSGMGYGLAAVAPSIHLLAMAQFILGLGTATFFAPLLADLSLWFRYRRGVAVAMTASGNYLAGAIWPVVLSGVLATQGWRAVCLILALLVAGVTIPGALLFRRRVPAEDLTAAAQATRTTVHRSAWSPNALTAVLFVAGLGCCVAMSMPQVHLVAFCVDLGYGPAVGAEMLSLMLGAGVISRIGSGLLADKLGGVTTLLIGSVGQMIALMLYLPSEGMTSLYVVSLIFGLSQGGIVPSYAVIVREYLPPQQAGARIGFVIMATILGMALGGWLSGWIYDLTGSYRMAFINGIAWNVLNVAAILLVVWRARKGGERLAMA